MSRFLSALLLSAFLIGTAAASPLFSEGRWRAPVVLSAEPEIEEWHAARTLADFCEAVTGARPELVHERPGSEPPAAGLFVGQTAAFRALNQRLPASEGDTALRTSRGDRVFLVGNSPAATRIAVGRFCEQHLGVVFAFPSVRGADFARLSEVGLPAEDLFRPVFAWRGLSGLPNELSAEWAANVGYGPVPPFSHGLHAAFDARAYAEDPTLFPVVNGVRRGPGDGYAPNPNLAHPRAPEVGARHARAWFHANPGVFSVALGVNDTADFDDGVPSEGWYRRRPVRTDYVISFLNQVADSFWQPDGDLEGRHHAIGTLAYLQTLAAPKQRVRPAVFPWVCADRLGYADPDFAAMESANLRAWVLSGARRVGAYDYWYGVDYAVPRANFAAQARSVRAAHEAGVVGWIAELYPLWAFDAPKAWLGAKLLEDPSQDAEVLLDRWFAAAYGPAAKPMREAYRVVEVAWARDVAVGGREQWIRHFRAERSADALNNDEVFRVADSLSQARKVLEESPESPRVAAQRWRLAQFDEAWRLAGHFRALVNARRECPRDGRGALAALGNLTETEAGFRRAQEQFNQRWGAYGHSVHWADFIPTNPRAAWMEQVRAEEALRPALDQWARADILGLFEQCLQSNPGLLDAHEAARWEFSGGSLPAGARVALSPSSYNAQQQERGRLRLVAPAGRVVGRESLPVAAGDIIRLSARLAPSAVRHPEARTRVTVRFPGSKKLPSWSAWGLDARAGLAVVVPPDATRLDYEVAFENETALESVVLHRVPKADLPSSP